MTKQERSTLRGALRRRRTGTSRLQVAGVVAVFLAFALGFWVRGGGGASSASEAASPVAQAAHEQGYTCSMHPSVRLPDPDDKCPICLMDLIPVTTTPGVGGLPASTLELSPQAAAMISVETVPVTRRPLTHRLRMVGEVAYDETRLSYLTAYAGGRLDRMFVDSTGVRVRQGDHLAEIYSPDLLIARQELLEAGRAFERVTAESGSAALDTARAVLDAARDRLRLLGLTPEQLEAAEAGRMADGQDADHVTLYAPSGGVVIEKHAKPGSYLTEGDPLYTLADLSRVWVMLKAYESDLPWLRYGQDVEFTIAGMGDEAFTGSVTFIDPTLNPKTRTVDVRVNAENLDGRLRPGMFVRASVLAGSAEAGGAMEPELAGKWISPMHPEVIRDEPGGCPVCGMDLVRAEDWFGSLESEAAEDEPPPLLIPQSAVLRTGARGVVYVQVQNDPAPRFEGRTVELGPSGEGFVVVRNGLAEGELVVRRGNFQIDSALQLQARPSMMNPAPESEQAPPPRTHVSGPAAEAIRGLVAAVFEFTQALAADDAAAAGQSAAAVRDASSALRRARVPAPLGDTVQAVGRSIAAMDPGADIERQREALDPLSQALIELLEAAHVEGLGAAYRAHCPMALGNRGASWLTPEEQVLNPYFGSRMLRCGSIEETLSSPEAASQPAEAPGHVDPHAGHNP